jgi:hypothetical protein
MRPLADLFTNLAHDELSSGLGTSPSSLLQLSGDFTQYGPGGLAKTTAGSSPGTVVPGEPASQPNMATSHLFAGTSALLDGVRLPLKRIEDAILLNHDVLNDGSPIEFQLEKNVIVVA